MRRRLVFSATGVRHRTVPTTNTVSGARSIASFELSVDNAISSTDSTDSQAAVAPLPESSTASGSTFSESLPIQNCIGRPLDAPGVDGDEMAPQWGQCEQGECFVTRRPAPVHKTSPNPFSRRVDRRAARVFPVINRMNCSTTGAHPFFMTSRCPFGTGGIVRPIGCR